MGGGNLERPSFSSLRYWTSVRRVKSVIFCRRVHPLNYVFFLLLLSFLLPLPAFPAIFSNSPVSFEARGLPCCSLFSYGLHLLDDMINIVIINIQVSGYGENGTGDANDVWRVEIDGGKEGDIVKTVLSRLARQTTPIHVGIQAPFQITVFFCEKAPLSQRVDIALCHLGVKVRKWEKNKWEIKG